MKQTAFTLSAFLFFAVACNTASDTKTDPVVTKEETKKEETVKDVSPPMDSAAMMKAWMDFATPGDMHKWMAKGDGKWTGEVMQWMDPAAPPTKSIATMTNKTVMGGLYQTGTYSGTMMGRPFEGMATMGYDNGKKMFVSTWLDNMGSGIIYMTGSWNDAAKKLIMSGKQTDPMTGKDTDIRQVTSFPTDNTQKLEMYGTGMDGNEMKFMEGTFIRK